MKYGVLYYRPTGNIGDEIQSVAARQFLPSVDVLVDRERMKDFHSPEQVKMILNGWYMCEPKQWPPADSILPLLISLHITREKAVREAWFRPDQLKYLLRNGPVGARDTETLEVLRQEGVDSYFSGCLTLTLRRNEQADRGDYICAVDVSQGVLEYLSRQTRRPVIPVTHWLPRHMRPEDTFVFAEMLLDLYQRAHCVVTTRLHAAMPCLALNTPVLLLESPEQQARFGGLAALARHCVVEDYLNGKYIFDLECPGENPQDYRTIRQNLVENCARFIGPDGEGVYAARSLRIFEGLLPSIMIWEKEKRFEKALVDLRRGRLHGLFAEIRESFAMNKKSKRRYLADHSPKSVANFRELRG